MKEMKEREVLRRAPALLVEIGNNGSTPDLSKTSSADPHFCFCKVRGRLFF